MRKRSCAVSYYTLFQLECAGIKLIILSLPRDQLIMAAALDNPSMLENHDHIRVLNRGQSVSDNEYGTTVHQRVHTTLHDRLCSRIDRRSRLVQNHNRRICNCRTRNRNQLSLSLGQTRFRHRRVPSRSHSGSTRDEIHAAPASLAAPIHSSSVASSLP